MQSEQPNGDVTLILKDGKEIRVSSNELSAVSDFFFTLQNTDMKERIEGIIRLEHVYEKVMRDVVEFMRSGSVHITHENHAKDLIEAADYFLLPSLKRAAGRLLEQTLDHQTAFQFINLPRDINVRTLYSPLENLSFQTSPLLLNLKSSFTWKASK